MFIPKTEAGEYPADPNEPPFADWEIARGRDLLKAWRGGHRQAGQPSAGPCPHEAAFCESELECLEKIAWWRRYLREIEAR